MLPACAALLRRNGNNGGPAKLGAEGSHCYKSMVVSGFAEEIWRVFSLVIYTFTMLDVAFVLAIALHCASASPLLLHNILLARAANTTIHSPTAWASNPSGRGTENILYSCFNTLFLCAWTAFHPNIQSAGSTSWAFLHRLKWMFIAIVLPETVLIAACGQWWAAKDLRDEINRLGQQNSGPTPFTTFAKWSSSQCVACNPCKKLKDCFTGVFDDLINRHDHERCECLDGFKTDDDIPNDTTGEFSRHRHVHGNLLQKPKAFVPWTMDQAFFAVSGGVALDTSPFWHRPYVSLTPYGVILLAEIGLLPCFSKQDVQDRSRADAIAKSISCLQGTWFFIQGVARVSAGLPLTLLELHTMTHIICALAMYAIWFSKPYGATSPMICSEPAMVNLAALLTRRFNPDRFLQMWCCPLKSDIPVRFGRSFHAGANDEGVSDENDEEVSNENEEGISNENHEEVSMGNDEGVSSENGEEVFVHLDAANKAIDFLRKRNIHLPFAPISYPGEDLGIELQQEFLVNNVSNHIVRGRFNSGVNKMDTHFASILIAVFSLLYCGSHLSAWNFHFPTVVEMWMWRGACFILLCAPFLFLHFKILLVNAELKNREGNDKSWRERSAMDKTRIILKYGFLFLHWLLACLILEKFFVFFRLYLLVESLASLRSPANGTYTTVQWTEYLPHFS